MDSCSGDGREEGRMDARTTPGAGQARLACAAGCLGRGRGMPRPPRMHRPPATSETAATRRSGTVGVWMFRLPTTAYQREGGA